MIRWLYKAAWPYLTFLPLGRCFFFVLNAPYTHQIFCIVHVICLGCHLFILEPEQREKEADLVQTATSVALNALATKALIKGATLAHFSWLEIGTVCCSLPYYSLGWPLSVEMKSQSTGIVHHKITQAKLIGLLWLVGFWIHFKRQYLCPAARLFNISG